MPNCIIYYRFSTEKQEVGDSIERQLRDCNDYAKAQGWTVIETIGDHGRSAYKGEQISKGNLGKLEQRIRAGEYPPGTILLVERLDRLSRELPRKTQRWMEDITDHDIQIVVANGGRVFDKETLQDHNSLIVIMDLLMNAMVAHHESKQKASSSRAWQSEMTFERATFGNTSSSSPSFSKALTQSSTRMRPVRILRISARTSLNAKSHAVLLKPDLIRDAPDAVIRLRCSPRKRSKMGSLR